MILTNTSFCLCVHKCIDTQRVRYTGYMLSYISWGVRNRHRKREQKLPVQNEPANRDSNPEDTNANEPATKSTQGTEIRSEYN